MSTFNDLIASIHSALHSYSGTQEQMTWLTADVSSTALVLPVASSDVILRGIAEIDEELVYVVSSSDAGLNLAPFGRGFRGSLPAEHSDLTAVTFDPVFPKAEIRKAIQQCVAGLFPTLYQIKHVDLTASATTIGYELPADCDGIIEVKQATVQPFNTFDLLGRWSFDANASQGTGKVLDLYDELRPGAQVRVVYRAPFGAFASGTDTFASVGLRESYTDLILYGVTAQLIRFLDPERLQVSSVENLSRATVVASGDAGKIANQLYSLYQQRLAEERSHLLELTSPSIHFTR